MKSVVLFDFHNTLATCDSWLKLEIETLPAGVLHRLASEDLVEPVSSQDEARAVQLFKALRQEVRESGVELSAVAGATRVLAEMGVEAPSNAVEEAVRSLELACLQDVEMVPHADEALEKLRDAGCRLGVVSSAGYPAFVELALETLGLRSFFSEVVTSAGEGLYKSDPEIFRRAVRKLAAEPSDAVHVGDHAVYDVLGAKKAGLSTVWFAAHADRTARLHSHDKQKLQEQGEGADAVIYSLSDLYDAVAKL